MERAVIMNTPHKVNATHSDGDGMILLRINGEVEQYVNLSKNDAMVLMAELAMAISDEYGQFSCQGKALGYSYPAKLAK